MPDFSFKMASLNILSLPKKFDEINLTMSAKLLDVLAPNETRLDQTINAGKSHIDGYELMRKDRSRQGGGVCIYLRNSINYQIREDIVATCRSGSYMQFIDHRSLSN